MSAFVFAASKGVSLLDAIAYAGFALTAIALAVAAYQLRMGFRQSEDFRQVGKTAKDTLDNTEAALKNLERVSQELSTRVMGGWPEVLSEFARFVEGTERYLKVLTDVPSYGIFDNLEGHREYEQAMENSLTAGHALDIIFMSRDRRRRLNEEFASDHARAWEPEHASRVRDWLDQARQYDPNLREPTNFEEYLDLLEETNQHSIRGLENAAELGSNRVGRKLFTHRETDSLIPLYIWVRDGIEAIFAVAVLNAGIAREIAFLTRDPGLVTALEAAFDRFNGFNGACGADLAPPWPRPAEGATAITVG